MMSSPLIGICFSMFVYIHACFRLALIGGNLTAQLMGSHGRIEGRSQVVSSPSFSCPAASAPGELALRLLLLCLGGLEANLKVISVN